MPGKLLIWSGRFRLVSTPPTARSGAARSPRHFARALLAAAALATRLAAAETAAELSTPPQYLGATTCATAGCHGGAGPVHDQFLVWSKKDFHSRSAATLTTARSARFADVLRLGDPAASARCTVCHAPLHGLPAAQGGAPAKTAEGVSCESCHGAAEPWLRAHTRRENWSHRDSVHAGLRDLRDLYVRANTCVACHQVVPRDLLAAGHPELLFELDGQVVAEPRHWREPADAPGPRAWLVGQATALRELSWALARQTSPDEPSQAQWAGLLWVLQKGAALDESARDLAALASTTGPETWMRAQELADQLARSAAAAEWSAGKTHQWLAALAASHEDFKSGAPALLQARRAERLVLALDRLVTALETDGHRLAEAELAALFKAAQSRPDFDPAGFARRLAEFEAKIKTDSAAK